MSGNTVISGGDYRPVERLSAGAIVPGEAVEVDSNGEFQRYATDGEDNPRFALARENEADPNVGIDHAYVADEPVHAAYVYPGATARVIVAANEDIAVGDELVIANDGAFRELNTGGGDTVNAVVARAVEAGNETSDFRIEAEFY